jgi:hypothetical protein
VIWGNLMNQLKTFKKIMLFWDVEMGQIIRNWKTVYRIRMSRLTDKQASAKSPHTIRVGHWWLTPSFSFEDDDPNMNTSDSNLQCFNYSKYSGSHVMVSLIMLSNGLIESNRSRPKLLYVRKFMYMTIGIIRSIF